MNEIEVCGKTKYVSFDKQGCKVSMNALGDINIYIYDVPTVALENIAKIVNKKIEQYDRSRWVEFAKARDGSKVTLFEA